MKLFRISLLLAACAWGQEFRLGTKVTDFPLADLKGNPVRYAALKGATTVVIFISTRCPVSNSYNVRMSALDHEYTARGVAFVFINANSNEPPAEVADHARSHGLDFPVYKDPDGAAADLFGAEVTPEVFVMDSAGTMRYHGYIDDAMNPARIHNQGLRTALDTLLAHHELPLTETKAFGCTIKRQKKTS